MTTVLSLTRGTVTTSTDSVWIHRNGAEDSFHFGELPKQYVVHAVGVLDRIVDRGRHELFESGYESQLARSIQEFVVGYGSLALRLIEKKIHVAGISEVIVEELFRSLGHLDDTGTHAERRRLLERQLFGQPTVVRRDAALSGLASLSDPAALPALRRAAEKEASPHLRDDIRKVISELSEGVEVGNALPVAPK